MTEQALLEKARKLGLEVANTKALLESLDKARESLEAARGQISAIIDEMRMQTTVSKERTAWCIRELDKLRNQISQSLPPGSAK
jgi:hypothetical protein